MSRPLRRRDALYQWEAHFGPNMTPMVDIVVVILIFFMAGTAFVGPEWFVHTALPRTGGSGQGGVADAFSLPPARFVVHLRTGPDGRTLARGLGPDEADLPTLASRLAGLAAEARGADLSIIVRPAPDVPYRDAVFVFDAAAAAGINEVGLGSE